MFQHRTVTRKCTTTSGNKLVRTTSHKEPFKILSIPRPRPCRTENSLATSRNLWRKLAATSPVIIDRHTERSTLSQTHPPHDQHCQDRPEPQETLWEQGVGARSQLAPMLGKSNENCTLWWSIPSPALGTSINNGSNSLSFLRRMPPSVFLSCNGDKWIANTKMGIISVFSGGLVLHFWIQSSPNLAHLVKKYIPNNTFVVESPLVLLTNNVRRVPLHAPRTPIPPPSRRPPTNNKSQCCKFPEMRRSTQSWMWKSTYQKRSGFEIMIRSLCQPIRTKNRWTLTHMWKIMIK